jgi:ankyrin repeat protein
MRRILFCFILLACCTGCSRSQNNQELRKAVENQDYQLAEKLLSSGADPNQRNHSGEGPLEWAVYKDDTLMIQILLNHGANVNSQYERGRTLLNLCVSLDGFKDYLNTAQFLIRHGAKLDISDSIGGTPLNSAVMGGDVQMVSLFLKYGANPNEIIAPHKPIPLYSAIFNRNISTKPINREREIRIHDTTGDTRRAASQRIIQMLLEAGASPNAPIPNNSGFSYLHDAVEECDTSVVKLLLQYGADKNVKDNAGERPYDLAVKNGCKDLEAILK